MLERHDPPAPGVCDVCTHTIDANLDVENEQALPRLATMILLEDLQSLGGGPARIASMASSTFPMVGDAVHRIEPRHWYWAVFHESDIQLVLERGTDGQR